VTIREGKYHQIKRMMASRGRTVLSLKRISIGRLALDESLAPGEWRFLSEEEKTLVE
jgi:16S rRNA pseudouridine516 synthase